MASDTDRTEDSITRSTEDGVSPVDLLEDVNNILFTLSEKITKCEKVLKDLKDLNEIVVRKSLQDLTIPSEK